MDSRPDPAPDAAPPESVLSTYTPPPPDRDRIWLHIGLFFATFGCMLFVAGGLVLNGQDVAPSLIGRHGVYETVGWMARLHDALMYAVPFLLFLTVHEFGHYLAARWHGVRVSLPYYIPLPFALGTFGAVIRIRERIRTTTQLFDIGAAGPLAGFVVALGALLVAVFTLPPVEYILGTDPIGSNFHAPIVAQYQIEGEFPRVSLMISMLREVGGQALIFGDTPLFAALASLGDYRVPGYEITHYPLLLAGWLGLFFTALNLLPVGQLDGGHVVYALFGPTVHRIVARIATLLLILSGSVGWMTEMVLGYAWDPIVEAALLAGLAVLLLIYLRQFFGGDWRYALAGVPVLLALVAAVVFLAPGLAAVTGYWGWLLWSGLILFLIRMDHPPVLVNEPLTPGRIALGWACVVIFLLCFSIQPIVVV
ncbi:MAG: site-2 protease family protein [Bacteroidota bacterium]